MNLLTRSSRSFNNDMTAQREATAGFVHGSSAGAGLTMSPAGIWVYHAPAANTKATKVVAAQGAGTRIIVTSFRVLLLCKGTAVSTTDNLTVKWIEDAAGAPATLDEMPFICEANKQFGIALPCHISVTANKSITLEFSAGAGADTKEYVGFSYIVAPA